MNAPTPQYPGTNGPDQAPVLVTGANGFVGYYLVERLLQRGFPVTATGRGACRLPFTQEAFRYRSLDFTDRLAVEELLAEEKPGAIIHSGALSKPDECEQDRAAAFRTNVAGTQLLLEGAEQQGVPFHFLSTDFVFSGAADSYGEEDLRDPVNYYGETKRLAEEAVMAYPHPWSIVRTVLVYGAPRQNRGNLLTVVANGLNEGRTLRIFTDQLRTPTYVEDLAEALVRILERKATGIYHIS
ncbi:MAG TPA: SDR family oxidoreductase, partial [Chitinophagaceae bacterium]|nr:SDR family oxidoreductase [Chitinophagaceae bacterium]